MNVLDVVDRVLPRPLLGEVDVDLDRLVVSAVDEEPARGVDADLIHEVVEEDDLSLSLRHLRPLAAARQMDELVEEHLDPARVVAEHPRNRGEPRREPVVVGAEHVDRAVVAAVELVAEVGDVGRLVGRKAALLRRADEDAVLLVAEVGRADVESAVRLVGRQAGEDLVEALLQLALLRPRVEVDAEPLERRLDPLEHARHRVAGLRRDLRDVVAVVAVRAAPAGPPGSPRPRRGTAPSVRPRRCSSTPARPRCRRTPGAARCCRRARRSGRMRP